MRSVKVAAGIGAALLASACATNFSAQSVRAEIVRQTGEDPQKTFELELGTVTMALARQVLAGSEPEGDGRLPLDGVTSFTLAVYSLPPAAASGARPLDLTATPVRRWEPTVRFKDGGRSGMVLVRASGDHVGDLVLLAAGETSVLFARLRGMLSRELPAALGEAVKSGGTEAVQRQLESLGGAQP